jgi:pimeloyl-ACP methyl ester carboxylesterase
MTVRLAATEYGRTEDTGTPVLAILHGLFGSGRNWASIAQRLAARRRVICFDLRNHGASAWTGGMQYGEMAEDVLAMLDERGYRPAALLGHSMGGKAAMAAALRDPDMVERLVAVDIAPVAYPPRHLSLVRAMRQLDLTGIERRSEADRLLAPAVPDAAERGFLLQNLVFENGRARWRLNLEAIERAMPDLVGFPAMPDNAVYRGPALFVGGGRSDYLLPEHEPEIRRLFPQARIERIENAGHWVHAEQPAAFLEVVEPFLAAAV